MRDASSSVSTVQNVQNWNIGDYLRIGVCCNQGGRKYMEDRVDIHCEFTNDGRVDYVYIGIYDGHGGASASEFANQHLMRNIVQHPGFNSNQDADVLEAIRAGFLETHNAMRKVVDEWPRTASGFTSTSGTTASIAFIRHGKLYIGHVGDSGIVLGSQKPTGELVGTSLTIDHKPDSPEEKKRMEEIGGEVMSKSGVMRVVWVRPLRGHQGPVRRSTPKEKIPFLAVARALGDLWSYNSDLDAYVVSPEPDVSVVQLDSTYRCLIFGSDGLWNVLRPQHATDIIKSHEWKEENWIADQNDGYETNHARWLVRHALMRWSNLRADNISVVTIIFGDRGTAESNYAKRIQPGITSIEKILTSEPTSVIKISPDRVVAVPTKPVELVYYGVSESTWERSSIFGGPSLTDDYYRIPGYTTHERCPIFGSSLLSTSSSASSSYFGCSTEGRSQTTFRHYSSSNRITDSNGLSTVTFENGKENGSSASSSTTTPLFSSRVSTITAAIIENMDEAASEVEDDTTSKLAEATNGTTNSEGTIRTNDQENGRKEISNGLLKLSSAPCKLHGSVQCWSCTLVRAPLAPRTPTATIISTINSGDQICETVNQDAAPPSPAAINIQPRRHTTSNSPSIAGTSTEGYKTRRIAKQRRSCPNPVTPHTYNTRKSCRTTRAGTKLSPQKSLFNNCSVVSPSLVNSKHNRRSMAAIYSENRRSEKLRRPIPSLTQHPVSTRLQGHRSSMNHQKTPSAMPTTTASAKAIRRKRAEKLGRKLRPRSSKTPEFVPLIDGNLVSHQHDNNMDSVPTGVVDESLDNLGAQLLESLNLETPSLLKKPIYERTDGRLQRQQCDDIIQWSSLGDIIPESASFLHAISPGMKTRNGNKTTIRIKNETDERRRRSSILMSLKRKLHFDDQALVEQKAPAPAMTTLSKRIKGLVFLKRSN